MYHSNACLSILFLLLKIKHISSCNGCAFILVLGVGQNNKEKDIRIKLFERFFNYVDFCSFQGGLDFCKALSIPKELEQYQIETIWNGTIIIKYDQTQRVHLHCYTCLANFRIGNV
jgi:hypothetical protein